VKNQNEIDIVLVYLGSTWPSYVELNLRYLVKNFQSHQIHFIGDSDYVLNRAKGVGARTFKTKNWREVYRETYDLLEHPMEFRSGFWFNTIARFFAISEFQQLTKRPLLQIECDVLIFKNFPFNSFAKLRDKIAFSMENLGQGSASILWIGNELLSTELVKTILCLVSQDPKHTDMTILGSIARGSILPTIVLPTLHPALHLEASEESSFYSANWEIFNGCFDALNYGMYIVGSDPRNSKGVSRIFQNREEQIIPSDLQAFRLDAANNSFVLELANGTSYPLYCLHNHAKDKRIWSKKQTKLLNRRSRQFARSRSIRRRFYPSAFFTLAVEKVLRSLK
jgi:hypothetical protein